MIEAVSGVSIIEPSKKNIRKTDLPLRSPIVWAAVALGGGTGALLRFYWGKLILFEGSTFPWDVFTENIIGAFVLGWLLTIFVRQRGRHRYLRALFGTGLVGSFTTFSGITTDLVEFTGTGNIILLIGYPLVSIIAGLAAAWAGMTTGRKFRKP